MEFYLKNKFVGSIQNILFMIGFAFICFFLFQNKAQIAEVSTLTYVGLLVNYFLFYIFLSLGQRLLFANKITATVLLDVNILSNFLNLILPFKSGVLYKATVLKRNFGVGYKDFTIKMFSLSLISLFVVLFFLVSLLLFWNHLGHENQLITDYFVLVIAGFVALLSIIFYLMVKKMKDLNLSTFIRISLFYSLSAFTYMAKFMIYMQAFNISISLYEISLITFFVLASGFISLLPGNIGLREFSLVTILALFNVNTELAIVIAFLDRVVQILFLGGFSVVSLSIKKYKKETSLFSIQDINEVIK